MNSWNKGQVNDESSSVFIFIPAILCVAAVWSVRRWWNSSLTLHTHAVSRRRKVTRDPSFARRPPPFPVLVHNHIGVKCQGLSDRSDNIQRKRGNSSVSEVSTGCLSMPGGRRNISRSSGRPPPPPPPTLGMSVEDTQRNKYVCKCYAADFMQPKLNRSLGDVLDSSVSRQIVPKHIPAPNIPQDGDIMFEAIMFTFTGMTSFLQFLHLYRTVWWLPQSYTRYTMNFYLIDPYLVGFIVTILGSRLVYCALSRIVICCGPESLAPVLQQLVRLILLVIVLSSLVWCAYHVMQNHPIVNIFYLCYPISVYFILFGLSISPFFDINALPPIVKEDCKLRGLVGKPMHNCSLSPQVIREEVEHLKTDFNNRMKQILFSSVLNAYYAGFVPCCFAQSFLYYDVYWATQHLAFVWLGCFTMYLVHCYPVKYCDVLHRAALHLGRWTKIEGRSSHIPTHIWAESTLWHQGALVKHCKELYKAEGLSNAAEPGNQTHARFYRIKDAVSEVMDQKIAALVSSYEARLEVQEKTIEDLRSQLDLKCDDLEQYQRRNSIRIFGKEETQGEDTDCIAIDVAKKIGVNLSLVDIDRSHRVGPKVAGKKRPIIVKFTSYRKRQEVFKEKRKLRGTGCTIREDLTRMRLELLRAAIDRFGYTNVWTTDGTIIVKVGNIKHRVTSKNMLNNLIGAN